MTGPQATAISPTQSNVLEALACFIESVLPGGIPVVTGEQNRVSAPNAQRYVVMTPLRTPRLATNQDTEGDCKFTGSISAQNLTVTDIEIGTINVPSLLSGENVATGTFILQAQTGTVAGEPGLYLVSVPQTLAAQTLACGQRTLMQEAEFVVQLDFHSLGEDTSAGDLAQTVSTAFRDDYAVTFFAGLEAPLNGISPFYADDPHQAPFADDQQQVEWRWILEARMQVNQTISVPAQYADAVTVQTKDVSALYPP